MSNMDKNAMSPLGASLFVMMKDMGRAQARIYAEGPLTEERLSEARTAVEMTALAHQPHVLEAFKKTEGNSDAH